MTGKEYNNQFSKEELGNEIWKDVPNYGGYYQVSNLGRVKGLDRYVRVGGNGVRQIKEFILTPKKNKFKYFTITFSKDDKKKTMFIHRIVMESFVEKIEKGLDCCHNDSNKSNNRLINLRIDNRKGNEADKVARGTDNKGDRCGTAKLTWKKVRKLRDEYKEGKNYEELGRKFLISGGNARDIVYNKTWVDEDYNPVIKKHKHVFTETDIKFMKYLEKNGNSMIAIAAVIGCHPRLVSVYLDRHK